MKNWLIHCLSLVLAVYWASNLFLWFPWSYNPKLGMILMLTVAPIAWAYTVYLSLITYPGEGRMLAAGIIALVFLTVAVLLDFIFFGLIRQAMDELYHPTTLYGYGYLLVLPFGITWIMSNKINRNKRLALFSDSVKALSIGLFCLVALILIIAFDIRF